MVRLTARLRDRRALIADLVLWVVLSAVVLGGSPIGSVALSWGWRVAALVPLAAAVALVRVLPPVSLCLVAALCVLDAWFFPALFVLSYLAGRHDSRERQALAVFAGIVVASTAVLLVLPGAGPVVRTVPLLALAVTPWLVGRYRRVQGDLAAAGWQRALDLERRQREVAERARLRERWRIAQDIHDQLGHELSLLAMRVGLLEVAGGQDEQVRRVAGELREVAQAAVERLHDVIGVLRTDDEPVGGAADRTPVPDDVATMVGAARKAGMTVVLRGDHGAAVPEPVEHVVRSVVREALTNASKHAPGATVRVGLRHGDMDAEVEVVNGAPPAGPPEAVPGGGSGLGSLAERIAELGGVFESGARDGGFAVRAVIPHAATATPSPREPSSRAWWRPRGLVTAAIVPLAAVVVLVGLMMAYFADTTEETVLTPGAFAGLELGQRRSELAGLLPAKQVVVTEIRGPAVPAEARCEHYRTRDGDLFESDIPVFRLCFTGGLLTVKDQVTARL